jgi:hypothetical protein
MMVPRGEGGLGEAATYRLHQGQTALRQSLASAGNHLQGSSASKVKEMEIRCG